MRITVEWKNNDEVRKNVLDMVDNSKMPTDFKVFRKYLLINSGLRGDDIKVSLQRKFGRDFVIQSEEDFQATLYQIRCNEENTRQHQTMNQSSSYSVSLATLLLEPIVEVEETNLKKLQHSNDDVQTESELIDDKSLNSTNAVKTPPEWFSSGLAQLKNELKDELVANISTIVADAVANKLNNNELKDELITHISTIVADAVTKIKNSIQQLTPPSITASNFISNPPVLTESVLNSIRNSLSLTKLSPTVQTIAHNNSGNTQDFSRLCDNTCPTSSVQAVVDDSQRLNKPTPKPTMQTTPLPDEVNCNCRLTPKLKNASLCSIDQCRMTVNLTFEDIRELATNGGSLYRNFTARFLAVKSSKWKLTIQRNLGYMYCFIEKYDDPKEMEFSYKMEGTLSILAAYLDCENFEYPWRAVVFGKRSNEIMKLLFDNYINWGVLCDPKRGLILKSDESNATLYNSRIEFKLAFSLSIIKH